MLRRNQLSAQTKTDDLQTDGYRQTFITCPGMRSEQRPKVN